MAAGLELVHATAIALGGRAVLIRGPSGSGKSDLALRCLACGPSALLPDTARLLSDDQVLVEIRDGRLVGRPPETLRGKIEVRGLGIFSVPSVAEAPLTLVADLVPAGSALERVPDPPASASILGLAVPAFSLRPFEASAPTKLLLALAFGLQDHR